MLRAFDIMNEAGVNTRPGDIAMKMQMGNGRPYINVNKLHV